MEYMRRAKEKDYNTSQHQIRLPGADIELRLFFGISILTGKQEYVETSAFLS